MKKEITLLFCSLLLCFSYVYSQSDKGLIIGKVLSPEGQAVSFANVVLKATADSSLVKVGYTNDDGSFNLRNISPGQYWLNVSYVGLPPFNSDNIELLSGQKLDMGTLQMTASANELDEVVVTAERPILELRPDKMVFNVEGSINATGNNALELLRKSPGVVVDNNDNVTMLGRAGVKIYIDGKPSPLSGDDLAALLKTIQSDEIDAIEIITQPSAKYEAEGNAGIINIRLKKDKRLGANANLNLGYNVGKVAKYNGTITGNYRNKKFNSFGSYSYNKGENTNQFNLYREQSGLRFDQRTLAGGNNTSHNFKAGTDFFLNKQNTVGFMVNGFLNENQWKSNSRMPIGPIGESTIDSVLIASSTQDGSRDNFNFNLNYRFDNAQGISWNIDADYGFFRNRSKEFQPNFYYDGTETVLLQKRINSNETPVDIDIYTFKLDHERPLFKGQLGIGGKFSYVKTDNTFDFFTHQDAEAVLDIDRSNQFVYDEKVSAAYVTYSRQFNKIGINMGIRMEQTNSTGDLTSLKPTGDDHVERHYTDFFPSGGISFAPNEKHNFQLSYSRRINRPSYQDLNPFENKLDELTFQKGNPFLRPEYANNLSLTHMFNYRLTTTLSFSHTKDLIARITDTAGDKASFITWLNLADQYNYSLSFAAPIAIKEWWSTYTNLTGYFTQNRADFGDGKIVNLDIGAFNIYSQHTFRLPKDFSFEVSGWYSSPSLWEGTFEMDSMWSLDAGVQKKIIEGRGNIKLSISDIFKSTAWHGVSQFGALFMDVDGSWDSRRFKINFSYLFGNTQVKGARNRKTGLEEEKGRVKTGN